MFKPRSPFKDIILGFKNALGDSKSFSMDRILIVSKLSRYEFERKKHKVDDKTLEKRLRARGTNFDNLLQHHDLHKKFEEKVTEHFRSVGANVDVVNRYNYLDEKATWADIIFPVGGDGTFLFASSRVMDNSKPVIGFNSDPRRSEGHLCLPKEYSTNVKDAIMRLQKGDFNWLLRSRIRLKLISHTKDEIHPKFLHEVDSSGDCLNPLKAMEDGKVLPVLALNEVFVGETISARVSHLKMRLDGSTEQTNMKSSGVCICTGTGSTSWHLSINRIPVQSVSEILNIINWKGDSKENMAKQIADEYNKSLVFPPDSSQMGYTIRDLISAAVWPQPKGIKSRGFAQKIELQSNCYDASLVVDGGISFPFNDGTIVFLEIRPEDALRTVIFD